MADKSAIEAEACECCLDRDYLKDVFSHVAGQALSIAVQTLLDIP